ncbi:MAG: sensor histidine kinase [Bacteroidia bacterium]|nr:sensor histidine kinase [Bacteroidia bacterium]
MPEIQDYPQIFAVATLIMLGLVGFIIFFVLVYQRRLSKQQLLILERESAHRQALLFASIQTQEEERQRIARDLHDEIGAMLSAVKMKVSQAKRKAKDDEVLTPVLEETSVMLTDSIQSVRRISHALLPPMLSKFGLSTTLKSLIEQSQPDEGPQISFLHTGMERRLAPTHELGLYRVTMEVVNNAIKYAQANKISVRLAFEPVETSLQIQDDGKGFILDDASSASSGLGLKNIESRLLSIGATWEFSSAPGTGTSLYISLPYENSHR